MKKILIIEDERTFAATLAEIFEFEGYDCIVTTGAAEAEPYLNGLADGIGALILDLMMVRGGSFTGTGKGALETGDQIYDRVRELAPEAAVIIVTAKTPDDVRKRYMNDKNTWIFFKPINEATCNQILSTLREVYAQK